MKLTCIFLFIACVQVSARAYSQDNMLSLNLQNVEFSKALKVIERKSDYRFLYNDALLAPDMKVEIHTDHSSVLDIVHQMLKGTSLAYKLIGEHLIVITAKGSNVQAVEVKGKVTNEEGEELAGATIQVKGTTVGAVTDANGDFSLTAPDNAILVISSVGYETKEIPVNGRNTLNISLKPSSTGLNELVVVGYGTQKKKDVTGAIGSYKPTVETARPVLGPDQMLQGRIPGVLVRSSSGIPGSSMSIRIRGIGSLSASNEPLYVIDGVPINNHGASIYDLGQGTDALAQLNPNDIESIEVLKDAAASAIYGSRATNGVVLITTKSGKKGKGKISLNVYTGIQEIPRMNKLTMANADEYVAVENEAINNYNVQNGYHPGISNYVEHIYNPYPEMGSTNWLKAITRTAKINNVSLSFSGGDKKGSFYVSGSYMDQQGVILTNSYKKYTGKINLNRNVNKWLTIGAHTFFSYSRNNRVPSSNRGSAIWLRALAQRPFDRPYKPDGSYYVGGTKDLIFHNPFQVLNERNSYVDNYRLIGNVYAEIKFLHNFTFKSSFGSDLMLIHDYQHYTKLHPYGAGIGRVEDGRRIISNLVWDNTLTYKKQIDKLDLSLLVGHSFQRESNSLNSVEGRGFPSPAFDVISVASIIQDGSSSLSGNALESYFARANLSWADKYHLGLSMRADGSSRFSPNNRVGYFPSVSAGWTMSKEDFWNWKNSDLKWRISYGNTGNQAGISQYAYQALMGGGYNYNEKSGIAVTTFGNDQLTWETARQFNVGFDLGLDNGKFHFTGDYYVKNTTNLLYNKPIYATSGFTSITSNIGSMKNNGLELSAGINLNLGPVVWSSNLNITFTHNKLTSLLADDTLSIGANRALVIGDPVGSMWIYKQLGIYQNDKDVPQPFYDQGVRAGDVKYEDVNNDGKINIDDRQIVGNSNPNFYGGWSNSFKWKGFDLNVFLNYMEGNDVYAQWRIAVSKLGNGLSGMLKSVVDNRWTGSGTSNETPRAIYGQTWNTQNSTRWLEDGSFLRVSTLSLGYSLPKRLISKININQLRVYVQGDNVFLLTGYSGIDPEVTKTTNPLKYGSDNFILPPPRTINVGINVTF